MFEKFKKMVSGGGKPPVAPSGRARPAAPRKPARPRAPGSQAPASAPSLSDAKPQATPREIPCPNCGEPMLSGWGTTCGTCRPGLVAPKTLFLSRDPKVTSGRMEAMTLGWLVVVSSLDQRQRGALLQLDQANSVLSRGERGSNSEPGLFEFSDIFMSSGHAIVTRPRTGDRRDAFSIRDRESAPTANGTFVNSRRIGRGESVDLADGDEVKVGATQMVFRSLWLPGSDARTS
ncbi:MAG TPA: FHA domain-containing protein [Polyangia bacterium]|nr:FHA domain-containing protein [Polyangia bacterium]